MPTLSFSSFPAEERARVEHVLDGARLSASEVVITKAIFPPSRMPGRIREMVTFVHGPISRTYACSANSDWLNLLAADVAKEAVRRARTQARPQRARPAPHLVAQSQSPVEDSLQGAAIDTAVPPDPTRLLHGAAVRRDDHQVLDAIRALPTPEESSACLFRAVILNESRQPYRVVDLYGLLESVSLTASLNALGFKLDAAKREGRSRRYDWSFSKGADLRVQAPDPEK